MIYKLIRKFIKDHGLKFSFVAEKAGIPNVAFISAMNGQRKISAEEYFAICDALGVSADTFRPSRAAV